MAIAFKKYQRKDSDNLKEIGTVKSILGKGGKYRFSKKNFTSKRLNKKGNRVAVIAILLKKDGTSAQITCSQQVSELLRSDELTQKQFLGLPIQETEQVNDETGKKELVHYITLPQGEEGETFSADEEVEEFSNSNDWLPESFITA